jgi:hypothetical protein
LSKDGIPPEGLSALYSQSLPYISLVFAVPFRYNGFSAGIHFPQSSKLALFDCPEISLGFLLSYGIFLPVTLGAGAGAQSL